MRQKRNANMRNEKALSGRKLILLFAVSLSAGIIGPLIGRTLGSVLQTSPAWIGPALLTGAVALALIGALLLPAAIRKYRATRRGPTA